jgi:polyphosphate kinase 2 (PPK2 family)
MGAGITTDRYKVKEGERVDLGQWPPGNTAGFHGSESQALEESRKLTLQLERLQEMLYAEHKRKLLIVLQAMDTGGKDGTIKKVFEGVNPQGVRVAHFRAPTPEEADHDFLWRAHAQAPESGEVGSSTGATTKECSSRGSTSSSRRRSAFGATETSLTLNACCTKTARSS